MKIKIPRELLLPALQAANNVVERRQTLPILSNVLFQTDGSTVKITATDMEVELVCELDSNADSDGALALPARKLFDICRALPPESELAIEGKGDKTRVSSGRSRFSLASMKAAEFPSIGTFDVKTTFEMESETLTDLLESTHFAMAHQDVRYYLNGLLLEMDHNRLRAVATDGHRLALTDKPIDLDLDTPGQYILPRKGVQEILRLMNSAEERVTVSIGENHLSIGTPKQTLTTKLVDGRFPDYERVIPRESDSPIRADRESLRSGLARASILSNEKFRGIRLLFDVNQLTAVAHNPEQEEAEEQIEIEYSGSAIEIGFNVSYLLDVLGVMRSEAVRIDLIDGNSSCLLRAENDEASRYVVMPMRL